MGGVALERVGLRLLEVLPRRRLAVRPVLPGVLARVPVHDSMPRRSRSGAASAAFSCSECLR